VLRLLTVFFSIFIGIRIDLLNSGLGGGFRRIDSNRQDRLRRILQRLFAPAETAWKNLRLRMIMDGVGPWSRSERLLWLRRVNCAEHAANAGEIEGGPVPGRKMIVAALDKKKRGGLA
jgi:hypothetical protein